ncbi:MAG: hypothetical protein AAGJ46_20445 [Planctomycetota bacterium]
MWCRHCQQDTPAVAQGSKDVVRCARCQQPTGEQAGGVRVDAAEAAASAPWTVSELLGPADEERLQSIERQLRSCRGLSAGQSSPKPSWRFDRPEATLPTAEPSPRRNAAAPPSAPRATSRSSQLAAWLIALAGALMLGGGISLMGWSLFGGRPVLWNWGVGASLAGQGLMIVGLVQLLANLWTAGREATGRLITLHYEIRRLQRTADGLAGLRTATPSAFYADLSRGASPQVLMANLKGQLDAMSARVEGE